MVPSKSNPISRKDQWFEIYYQPDKEMINGDSWLIGAEGKADFYIMDTKPTKSKYDDVPDRAG